MSGNLESIDIQAKSAAHLKFLIQAIHNASTKDQTNKFNDLKVFVDGGGPVDLLDEANHSLLRQVAKRSNNDNVVQYLIQHSTNLPQAFRIKQDLKDDAVMLGLKFLGCWFAVSALLYGIAVGIGAICADTIAHGTILAAIKTQIASYGWNDSFPSLYYYNFMKSSPSLRGLHASVFHSVFFSVLWIAAIVAAVVGLIITLVISFHYLNKNYFTAPGYLGQQQQKLYDAIRRNDFVQCDAIFSENIQWLFVPISVFRYNAWQLLLETNQGCDQLKKLLPKIINNPSALTMLMSQESNHWLKRHPELLSDLVDTMSPEQCVEHHTNFIKLVDSNVALRKKFLVKLTNFRATAWTSSILEFNQEVALTSVMLGTDDIPTGDLKKDCLDSRGFFGVSLKDNRAKGEFRQVEQRMRGIQIRSELTDEWKKRNVALRTH